MMAERFMSDVSEEGKEEDGGGEINFHFHDFTFMLNGPFRNVKSRFHCTNLPSWFKAHVKPKAHQSTS
jgi:hypothetical protein